MEKFLREFRTPIIFFCLGVLFATISIWVYVTVAGSNSGEKEFTVVGSKNPPEIKVDREIYVTGAVNKEGIFKIKENEKVFDFIQHSIGFNENADIDRFENSIKNAVDASFIIYVPSLCEESLADLDEEVANDITDEQEDSYLISINTASKSELESLPGIGSVYAERIIQGRPYSQLSDLKRIKGIGDKTYSKLEMLICL